MRATSLKIAASLAFALVATQAFAHAQLEKATPPSAARSPRRAKSGSNSARASSRNSRKSR